MKVADLLHHRRSDHARQGASTGSAILASAASVGRPTRRCSPTWASGSSIRLSYDGGDLELMSPGGLHDRYKHRFGRMIEGLTEELDIPIDGCGSTTLRRGDVEKGLEPDEAFYIQNEARVRGKFEMDLDGRPAARPGDRDRHHQQFGRPRGDLRRHRGPRDLAVRRRIAPDLPAPAGRDLRADRGQPELSHSCRSRSLRPSSTPSPARTRRAGRNGSAPGSAIACCPLYRAGRA